MKMQKTIFVSDFEYLNFEIVSYFMLRISDFLTTTNGSLWLSY